MTVSDFKVKQSATKTHISATFTFSRPVGNKKKRLSTYWRMLKQRMHSPIQLITKGRSATYSIWFSIPASTHPVINYQDAFFIVALGLSLYRHEDLFFDEVVSPQLLEKLPQFKKYFDYGQPSTPLRVTHRTGKLLQKKRKGIAQFFTLGVDSFHTLLCQDPKTITGRSLIYVEGFDVPLHKKAFLHTLRKRIQHVAAQTNSKSVFVETNLRELSDDIIGWGQYHVCALAAVATLLSFEKIYLNGETFDWPDWGLRAGVDTLFSFDDLSIKLVGHNKRRDRTIQRLLKSKQSSLFLDHVRVCWLNVEQTPVPYNCSQCQKCFRTLLTLQALGIDNPATFKPVDVNKLQEIVLNIHVYDEWVMLYKLLRQQKTTTPQTLKAVENIIKKPIISLPSSYQTKTIQCLE